MKGVSRVEMKELSKDQKRLIVAALKCEAQTFCKHADLLDSNGKVRLSFKQQNLIKMLPESMRETARKELFKENKWQEESFKSTMELAKEIESSKVYTKKD